MLYVPLKLLSKDVIISEAREAGIDIEAERRLLFRTTARSSQTWLRNFCYLTPDAGKFLAAMPNLVLVGTDACSIDAETQSIHSGAHIELVKNDIAILEGLNFNGLPLEKKLHGVLYTCWIPLQIAPDAKGCCVHFYRGS